MQHAGGHQHPLVVVVAPLSRVIRALLVFLHARKVGLEFARVPVVDAAVGHAFLLPVFQPDRIHEHQRIGRGAVHQRITRRQHAAHRMSDHAGAFHAQVRQQRLGVGRKLVKRKLIARRFVGFAKADLVGHHDSIACLAQRRDRGVPGGAAEVLAVHEHDGAAVGLRGLYVHIGHR
ncbi:hypothetical protein D3C71_1510050 [compost metagenome]